MKTSIKVYYACICIVFGSLVGCQTGVVNLEPIIKPAPVVNLDVPATAGYLQDITISWSSINATAAFKSFVEGTAVTGSFVVKGITQTTTFSITVQGEGGTRTVEKTVSVAIPMGADTLKSHGWKLVAKEFWTKSTNTLKSKDELAGSQLTDVLFFLENGSLKMVHIDGTYSLGGPGSWSLTNRTYTNGDQVYTVTLLNDLQFQYEQDYKWGTDQVVKFFYEKAK